MFIKLKKANKKAGSFIFFASILLVGLIYLQLQNPPTAYASGPYTASVGFSSTQGTNQWYYQQRAIGTSTYSDLTFTSGAWRGAGGNWISDTGAHPDNSKDAVRKWVAPSSGTVAITGRVFKVDTTCGNGIVASVLKNGTSLWSQTVAYNDGTGYTTDASLGSISVTTGDAIYFIINNNGDYSCDASSWDPTITYAGDSYTASVGFTSTQGANQWYYQQRAIGTSTYTDMSFSTGAWRGAGGNWISDTGAHPDNSKDAVRKWVAPSSGTIAITGRVFKVDTTCGNGIVASVLKNGTTLWSQTVAYNDGTGYTTDASLGSVSVTTGDAIYFIINNNGDYSCDASGWNPTLTYSTGTPTPPVSWPASAGFSSTQGLNQWYYQQRAIGTNTFVNMTFSTGSWRGGSGNWISVNNSHPDNSNDTVRTWVAPSTGTISITGRAYKINYLEPGNGVVVSVQKNNTVLWTKTIAFDDWLGYYMDADLSSVSVTAGDSIRFIVNNNGDYGADETGWDPTITYAGTAPVNKTYYISASGSDSNSGTDSSHPWQTIAPLNSIHYFGSGVQILFRGGDTFAGGLSISMVGTSGSRDVIGSYGTGKATLTDLAQPTTDIAVLSNSEYVTVQNLNFIATPGTNYGTNSFVSVNHSTGLKIYSTRTSGTKWRSVYIDSCLFQHSRLGAWYDSHSGSNVDGFDDVKVTNSVFDSTPLIGIIVYGNGPFAGGPVNQHSNVYIGSNKFIHIYGDAKHPSEAQPVEVTGATGIIIEKNLIADNCGYGGYNPIGGSTAVGISNSRNFKIQYNEIYGTKSSTPYDGSAIDADQDAQNGEIAYNLTYNNLGPAIQLGSFGGKTTSNIAIHHNISYNDARGNTSASIQGAIRFWGNTDSIQLFNNTVYLDKTGIVSGSVPSILSFEVGNNTNLKVWNNIFKTTQGVPMIRPNGTVSGEYNATHINSGTQFIANLYDSSGGSLIISTDNTTGTYTSITSLASWRSAGQEKISTTNYGVAANAGLTSLTAPSGYLPTNPVSSFSGFDLTSGSAARGQANNPWSITTETSPITIQTSDYHGNTGTTTDIGADTY